MAEATTHTAAERDERTIKLLDEAAGKIQAALQEMPNHVESAFDPRNDVPLLTGALERVRDVSRWAQAKIENVCARCGGEGDVTDDPDELYERMVCPGCGGSGKASDA